MEDKIAIRGIPSVTYARVLSSVGDAVSGSSSSDIVTEGNSIMLVEPGQPSMRYDVAQVSCCSLNKSISALLFIFCYKGAGFWFVRS